ncbi:MAG: Crp/Fnr family transcriptional regulator [Reichenbachiella sp.]|uniref:Crp/Fnr family transcriptional regulator n=1 Tax=Reichenbachiella sp. TaxID=2184521 RepID=UPI0032633C4A
MRLMKYWFLEDSFNMMKRMGMRDMMNLCELLVMKTFKKGSEIHQQFEEDHLIYFIKKGHVKIGKKEGDEFTMKYVLGKGNIFGESKITSGEDDEPYSAIAMSECIICFIEVDRMEELMLQYPKLHNSILKLAGFKFKKIERRLDDIIYKDADTRIKDFLFDFVKENGTSDNEWRAAKNIFSHSDIAKLTSTSRQTVNNVISSLRKDGEITYDRKEVRVFAEHMADAELLKDGD